MNKHARNVQHSFECHLSAFVDIRFFFLVSWNSQPEIVIRNTEISNRNFLSSDIDDDRDSDGRRNTSRWLFLARETSTTGKEITFHQATYPPPGVYGLGAANDIRGGRRNEGFDDSAHFRSFVFRWGARVIAVLSKGTENRLIRAEIASNKFTPFFVIFMLFSKI